MEENKYYTPQIEEFKVGFRYELLDIEYPVKWEKFIFKDGSSAENLIDGDYGEVRVKFLDKTDIEELGFNYVGCGFTKSTSVYRNKNGAEIWKFSDSIIAVFKHGIAASKLFNGTIKNYNELEVLLKQLGII